MPTFNGTPQADELFGSADDDILNGLGGDDQLTGHSGNDQINGGGGNDVLVGGAGNDTLDGGDGTGDRVLYYRETGTLGIVADLQAGTVIDTFGNTDTLIGIEQIYGTERADRFTGRFDAGDLIFGRGGNDTIDGRGGNDTLIGGSGNDTIIGGAGVDQIAYFLETGTGGIRVDVDAGTVIDTFGDTDSVSGIEQYYGTERADTFLGSNTLGDLLFGRGGNDLIEGRGGDDTLVGGAGNDTLDGGLGDDQLAYFLEGGGGAVRVDLEAGTAIDTFGDTDVISGIDRVYGATGDDTVLGSNDRDRLFGQGGNDTLDGRDGNDTLVGGSGNDTLNGGAGNDQVAYFLEGGSGGVTVDLAAGTATDTYGNDDTLISIEYAFGSNADDVLLGTDVDGDRLFGRDGNDTIDGRDGDNLIYTGAGDDVVRVGTTTFDARDTVVINGNGNKTITGTGSEGTRYGHHIVFEVDAALTVNLGTGIATTANGLRVDFTGALHFLEVGGSAYADSITGGNPIHDELEWYVGHQGDDTIDGGTGSGDTIVYDDEVIFGQFNYELGRQEYGTHGAAVNLATGVATDTFGFTDTLINIDQIRGTSYADTIIGSDEDNGFWTLGGNDVIDGGEGFDRIHYDDDTMHGGTGAANVNLITGRAVDGYGNVDTLTSIEGVFTTGQNDTVIGNDVDNRIFAFDGDDTVRGGGGNDVILGHGGQDTLRGEAGDDEIWGGAGSDIIDGGSGRDVVRYRDAEAGITASLVTNRVSDGMGGTDTLMGIENVHGSDFADRVTGDTGANQIFGYGGADTLDGGAGNDSILGGDGADLIRAGNGDDELRGEAGADTLDGGAGIDVARYLDDTAGVSVNLVSGQAVDGSGSIDTLIGIENVHGSGHGDTLRGDVNANQLFGYGGNDLIEGAAGNDTLLGGTGDDRLNGGANDDALHGEAGNDTLDGGAGNDLARYLEAASAINVNLGTGLAADGDGGQDSLISIEGVHGSAHNDTISGDAGGNQLSGFGGDDLLVGADGDDTMLGGDGADNLVGGKGNDELWGEAGNDTLNGADGNDLARYRGDVAGITADMGAGTVRDGSGAIDSLISIENLHGSDHGDRIGGDDEANRLFGFGGDDTITGGDGNDIILGGDDADSLMGDAGNDEIWGGGGDDTIDGGAGIDLVRYLDATGAVTAQLGDVVGTANDGMGGTDVLRGIENVHGSDHGDILAGNNVANQLFGFDGADTLDGAGGDDILLGGAGNDSITGGVGDDQLWGEAGTDLIDGGEGLDIARYRSSTAGVDADLVRGLAQDGFGYTDTLISIEHLHGSDHADVLRGNDEANQLFGYNGADTILGGGGADTLSGGEDGDTYVFDGRFGYTVINDLGGAGTDHVVINGYLAEHADILQQGANIVLAFGRGDVIVLANSASASSSSAIERVTFADGETWTHAQLLAAVGQTQSVARITANDLDNVLFGQLETTDILDGQGGNDIILGLDRDDQLAGGSGSDTIRGGDGEDTITGGTGNDVLYGNAGSDAFVLRDGDGADRIMDFEFGVDYLDVAGARTTQTVDADGNRVVTLTDFDASVTLVGVTGTGAPTPDVAIRGTATEDATLTAELSGLIDLFGQRATTQEFQWMRDGVAVQGATFDDYVLTQADVGAQITVVATVGGTEVTSAATSAVENVNDRPDGGVTVTGTTREDSTLRADTSGLSDQDGLGTLAYQWLRDGQDIAGATRSTHLLTQEDVGALVTVQVSYIDTLGTDETVLSDRNGPIDNLNDAPTGIVRVIGAAVEGNLLTSDATTLDDDDGMGTLAYQWLRNGQDIAGATGVSYTLAAADVGAAVSLEVSWTDGQGTVESVLSDATSSIAQGTLTLIGTSGDNVLQGGDGNDNLSGLGGNDRLHGNLGNDTLNGGEGTDTLIGGAGNDSLVGGDSDTDLRDVVYGGDGDDTIDGGYGNDELRGDAGNDEIAGGFGADTVIGGTGDDTLTGSAFGDEIFGGDGFDFINGGFGSDRVNGGAGGDQFYHMGIFDHGSDWIQDYNAAEGDVLRYGGRVSSDLFQVNVTTTANAGADDVQEAFVIYRPSGQILWALVDGAGQDQINIQLGSEIYNLLG